MNFSSWAYKSLTKKLSRTKITAQLSHSSDVTTACLGLEAMAVSVHRAESFARPWGTNSFHWPDIRSTAIKYNPNHLPWPQLKSCSTNSCKCVTGNTGVLSHRLVHVLPWKSRGLSTRRTATAQGPRSNTALPVPLSNLLSVPSYKHPHLCELHPPQACVGFTAHAVLWV